MAFQNLLWITLLAEQLPSNLKIMVLEIVIAILLAWAVLAIGKKVLRHFFYDSIGRAERIMADRLKELKN